MHDNSNVSDFKSRGSWFDPREWQVLKIHPSYLGQVVFWVLWQSKSELYKGSDSEQLKVDWLQSLKQMFINESYHILVASLTLMALF